jgi:hypothetical protein
MKRNIGPIDRTLRLLAGGAIIGIGLYTQSGWGWLGILPILAAIVGYCPPYALLGINTAKP